MDKAVCLANCGKDFKDSEKIIAVTNAVVSDADDAIIPDDQPWLALYHQSCWETVFSAATLYLMEVSGDASSNKTDDTGQPD